jgi:hypothetical protein
VIGGKIIKQIESLSTLAVCPPIAGVPGSGRDMNEGENSVFPIQVHS